MEYSIYALSIHAYLQQDVVGILFAYSHFFLQEIDQIWVIYRPITNLHPRPDMIMNRQYHESPLRL